MTNEINWLLTQRISENITEEIDMVTIIFHWKMRKGKTINAINLSQDKRYNGRIYSNVNIYKNWKSILIKTDEFGEIISNKFITTFEQLDKIRYSKVHGLIIIDEAGLNANSKDSHTLESRVLQKVLFLAGKKNCSLVWISQRYDSIDINVRVLADLIVEVRKKYYKPNHPKFMLIKQRQKFARLEWIQAYNIDTITLNNINKISYNTLQESIMDRKPRKQKTKTKNEE